MQPAHLSIGSRMYLDVTGFTDPEIVRSVASLGPHNNTHKHTW